MHFFFSRQNVNHLQERRLKGRELLLSSQETSMVQQVRYATEGNRFDQCPLGSTYLLFWNTLLFTSRYEQRPVCAHNRSYISSNQAQIDRCGLNPLFIHPPELLLSKASLTDLHMHFGFVYFHIQCFTGLTSLCLSFCYIRGFFACLVSLWQNTHDALSRNTCLTFLSHKKTKPGMPVVPNWLLTVVVPRVWNV